MTKRRRKIPEVDQLAYMKERGDEFAGEIKFKVTNNDRIMMNIRNLCSFLDEEETFQTIRALIRIGTCQFNKEFLERVQRYAESVKVI